MSPAERSDIHGSFSYRSPREFLRELGSTYKRWLVLTAAAASSSKADLNTKKPIKARNHESTSEDIRANEKIKELQAELVRAQQEVREVKRKAEVTQPDILLASRARMC
jgi:hypothetical protein